MKKGPPKVSVYVVAYNQEMYIRECLESVVAQQTSYSFEVLVADDCSTDGTWDVISEFQDKYPFVRAVRRTTNMGPIANARALRMMTRGEYLCHLDGDDYCLPGKIQKQAEFLDAHPEVAFVTHDVIKVDDVGNEIAASFDGMHPSIVDAEYLLKNGCFFTNSSKMVRRTCLVARPIDDPPTVDFQLHLEAASFGLIGWLPEVLGAYRIHHQGVSDNPQWRTTIEVAYERAYHTARRLGYRKKLVKKEFGRYLAGRAKRALKAGELSAAKKAARAALRTTIIHPRFRARRLLALSMGLHPQQIKAFLRKTNWKESR